MAQRTYSGDDTYKSISIIFENLHVRKVLLVCGSSFDKQKISREIVKLPVEIIRFSGVTPNPKYEEVLAGLKIFKEHSCDAILVIGGGSYIDVAKCIKLWGKMSPSGNYLKEEWIDTKIPLIAIPTTAGTGSESTKHSVIYYNGVKQSISHFSIIPNYVVLDPILLKSLPEMQRKCTMLDTFAHAVESYWSIKADAESKGYAKKAIEIALKYKEEYLANTDIGNEKMLIASNMAGKAINITTTTAGHAMSYKLTSLYGIPHGYACALALSVVWPYMMENIDECIHPVGKEYFVKTISELADMFDATVDTVADKFVNMVRELNLPRVSAKNRDEIKILTETVNIERLSNFPVRMTPNVIEKLYIKLLFQGE